MPDSRTRRLRKYLADMERIPFDETERTYNGQEARAFGVDLNPDWQVHVVPEPGSPRGYRVSYLTPEGMTLKDDGTLITSVGDVYTLEDIEEYENQLQYQPPPGTVGEQAQAEYPGLEYEAPPEDPEVVAKRQADYQRIEELFGTAFPEQDMQAVLALAETQPEQFVAEIRAGGQSTDSVELLKTLFPDISDDEITQLFQTEPEASEAPEGELTPAQKAYRKYQSQGGIMTESDWLVYQKGKTFTEEGGEPGEEVMKFLVNPLDILARLPQVAKDILAPRGLPTTYEEYKAQGGILTQEDWQRYSSGRGITEEQQNQLLELMEPTGFDVLTAGLAVAPKAIKLGIKGFQAAKEAKPVVGKTLAEVAGEAEAIGKGAGKGKPIIPEPIIEGIPGRINPEVYKGKSIWEMDAEELATAVKGMKTNDRSLLDELFGAEGAKRYRQLESAENSMDLKRADQATKLKQQMEDSLSEAQQNRLFGIGEEGASQDELQGLLTKLTSLDTSSATELGKSLRWSVTDLPNHTDLSRMTWKEKEAVVQFREAYRQAIELGYDPQVVAKTAVQSAASRFSDPEDAQFMLSNVLELMKRKSAPSPLTLPKPQLSLTEGRNFSPSKPVVPEAKPAPEIPTKPSEAPLPKVPETAIEAGKPPPVEPPPAATAALMPKPPPNPLEKTRIITQAQEQVRQVQPGKLVKALERIPGIREALQWERPALKLKGEAQKIHVAMVAQTAAKTDVATRELATRLPLLRQAESAFGKESLSGGKVNAKFLGTSDQSASPLTGTLKDIAENPELYDLSDAQKKWLTDLQARNDESLAWVVDNYGAEIGRFNPKSGGAFLPNVDISEDVIEWMGGETQAIARGRGKTRFYQTARDRMAADKTFQPETNVRKLIEGLDNFKASAAGGITYREALGGLTKLEVMETRHPELYARMIGLRQQLQSLKGSLSRLETKLHDALDDFLKSGADDVDLANLQDELDVKLEAGKRKGMGEADIQTQIDEVKAAIKDLRPAWNVANPKPYVFIQDGIFRYFPSDQAKLIQESLRTSNNPFLTFMERWRGGAFSGDVSPFAIQGSIGVLADPIGSVKTGIGAAKSAIKERDILRSYKIDALADDIAADPKGWAEYASMRGFAPSGTPSEYAAGFLSKIPGFDKFTEATYLTVTRQGKALWSRATADLVKAGVPELEAKVAAVSMVNKIYPYASATLLGQSPARAALLRALPTSYSFIRKPAEMMAQATTGIAKLVIRQPLTAQERMAVKLMVTMAASVMTASVASAAASAKALGKSDEEIRQAMLDAINPDPYNSKFASIIIGDKRIPIGGPYRAIFRALYPQTVKGVPFPVPMYGLLYWNDKKQMPDGYLWNRINPALKTQIDLFYNRDYAGKRIRTAESVPLQTFQAIAYEIENALPLSLGAAVEGIRHGDEWDKIKQDIISQFAGVNMVTLDDTYFDRQIKRLGQVDPNQEQKPLSTERPVYTIKNLWSDVNRVLADSTQEEIAKRRMPALAKTITEVKRIKNQVDQTRNHALTDKELNPDTGDTFVQFYEQWQERQKIDPKNEKALAEFDKKYPKARYGNMTAREYDALRRYTELKESDPAEAKLFLKAHPELKANPREDWLKAHPDENAKLAVMGQAKILSKEAWDKAQSYIQQWDIPDGALPDFDLPKDEETRSAYFEYQKTREQYGAASPEAYLMLAQNGALRKYLNHSEIKTPVPALEIQVKNRKLDDQYEALTNEKDKAAFEASNPKWQDDRERVEAYQQQYKYDNTVADAKLVEAFIKYRKLQTDGERDLYRLDNPDFDQWGQTVGPTGAPWKPVNRKSIDALRLQVKNRAKSQEFEGLNPTQRADYLKRNPDFAADQQRIAGYEEGVPKDAIELYAKYGLIPEGAPEGSPAGAISHARERFLAENKDYHDRVWVGILKRKPIDLVKVASEKFEKSHNEEYLKAAPGAERELFRYLNPEFDEEGVKIGRWKPLTVKSGEARKLAVQYQKQDREYASIPEPAKQKQYLVDNPEFAVSRVMRTGYNDGVPANYMQEYVTWKMTPMSKYALERFMASNLPFYNEVYKGILGKDRLDFRNIMSEALEAQLKVYNDLRGTKKTAYLKSHGALRKWMERERKLRPSQATDMSAGAAPVFRVAYA